MVTVWVIEKCMEKLKQIHQFKIMSQNVRGLKDPIKLEHFFDKMMQFDVKCHLTQETWLKGNKILKIKDIVIFAHS